MILGSLFTLQSGLWIIYLMLAWKLADKFRYLLSFWRSDTSSLFVLSFGPPDNLKISARFESGSQAFVPRRAGLCAGYGLRDLNLISLDGMPNPNYAQNSPLVAFVFVLGLLVSLLTVVLLLVLVLDKGCMYLVFGRSMYESMEYLEPRISASRVRLSNPV